LLVAQAAGILRAGSARHPTVTGRGSGYSAVTGRQRYRALSGRSPAGAAAAAGPLARIPPRPVPHQRPVATPAKSGSAVPSRRASCHRAKITVKGRACGAALRAGASATP